MKRSLLPVLVVLLAFAGSVRADSSPADAAGVHAAAAREYDQAIAAKGYSVDRLYDRGTARLAEGHVGPAIADLTRAHVLAPRDGTIDARLAEAYRQARVAPPARTRLERLAAVLSPREWAFGGALAGALAAAAVLASVLLARRWRRLAGLVGLAALVLAATGFAGSRLARRPLAGAVVLEDGLVARRSPFGEAAPVLSLAAGETVDVQAEERGFAYVEAPGGGHGWVPDASVTRLGLADTRSP